MAAELIMPKLGMGMEKGTVVEWVKAKNDPVSKGDIVVIVSSDKIEIEVESPADGLLLDITVPAGEEVPVGTVIGYVGQAGEVVGPHPPQNHVGATAGSVEAREEVSATSVLTVEAPQKTNGQAGANSTTQSQKGNKVPSATPVARKMAREAGLDLSTIEGTGPNGRITKEDVQRAIALKTSTEATQQDVNQQEAVQQGSGQKLAGIRKVIADRMVASLQQSAQVTLTASADITELLQLKNQVEQNMEQRYGVKPSLTAYIARAAVLALLKYPSMNTTWDSQSDSIISYDHVHLGIAVAVDKGLLVPVIQHAERLNVGQLAKWILTNSDKARNGQLAVEEMKGSTFSITNLGQYGVEWFTPILNPPETGILGVGAYQTTPVYDDGHWVPKKRLPLSLTFDHRIVDGAPAAQFLQEIKKGLENPLQLLI